MTWRTHGVAGTEGTGYHWPGCLLLSTVPKHSWGRSFISPVSCLRTALAVGRISLPTGLGYPLQGSSHCSIQSFVFRLFPLEPDCGAFTVNQGYPDDALCKEWEIMVWSASMYSQACCSCSATAQHPVSGAVSHVSSSEHMSLRAGGIFDCWNLLLNIP